MLGERGTGTWAPILTIVYRYRKGSYSEGAEGARKRQKKKGKGEEEKEGGLLKKKILLHPERRSIIGGGLIDLGVSEKGLSEFTSIHKGGGRKARKGGPRGPSERGGGYRGIRRRGDEQNV